MAFLPALLVPHFPPNVLAHTNLLLQLAFALLLARSMRGPQTLSGTAPSWGAIGGAVLLTAAAYIIVNLLTDVVYRWVNPRLRARHSADTCHPQS